MCATRLAIAFRQIWNSTPANELIDIVMQEPTKRMVERNDLDSTIAYLSYLYHHPRHSLCRNSTQTLQKARPPRPATWAPTPTSRRKSPIWRKSPSRRRLPRWKRSPSQRRKVILIDKRQYLDPFPIISRLTYSIVVLTLLQYDKLSNSSTPKSTVSLPAEYRTLTLQHLRWYLIQKGHLPKE